MRIAALGAGRMGRGVAVRMAGQAGFSWPLKAGKKQSPAGLKGMHIYPKPHPRHVFHAQQTTGWRLT